MSRGSAFTISLETWTSKSLRRSEIFSSGQGILVNPLQAECTSLWTGALLEIKLTLLQGGMVVTLKQQQKKKNSPF